VSVRIADIRVHVVNVPFRKVFASTFQTRRGTTRVVVRVRTDDGLEGLGESMRGRIVAQLVERHKPLVIGTDAFDIEPLLEKLKTLRFYYGYAGYAAVAAIEMACWDLVGKSLGVPIAKLLGGHVRNRVPAGAVLTRGALPDTVQQKDIPAALADEAQRMLDESQFRALKLKGSFDAEADVAIMQTLRRAHPDVKLRIDPSGVWTTHQAIWAGMRMEPLDLEYVEDACTGLESMAAVRQKIRIPLCTNMCVVRPEDFAPAMRLNAVDVIHGDVHRWGGISVTKRLGALCDAFGLGMNLHTAGELGISTACHLQLAAAMPEVRYAIDSLYDLLADDVVTEPMRFSAGFFTVPDGPGLGVALDLKKLERYEALNEAEGDYNL
jgi:glucarate dehydratase